MNCCNEYGQCKGGKGCPVGEPLPPVNWRGWLADAVVEPADSPMPVVEPEQQVQAEQPRRMSLWSINVALAPLEVNCKTLESLGFHETYAAPRTTHADYLASDFPKICQAIADHVTAAAKGAPK